MSRSSSPGSHRRLKVLQVLPSMDMGGAERLVLNLLDELDRNDFQTEVCVLGDSPFVEAVKQRGVPVSQVQSFRSSKDVGFLRRLIRAVKLVRPDVIHSHIWLPSFYAGLCGRALGIPVIGTFHSNYNVESLYERFSLCVTNWCCYKVVLVSQSQMRHFRLLARSGNISVILNGVCLPEDVEAQGAGRCQNIRKELGLESEERVITCVANLRPVKAHSLLLDAFRAVAEVQPNLKLLLVGDGPLLASLRGQCEDSGIRTMVQFLGVRADVLDILAITDVFVSSSSSEALSMAILEAMAMGKPVIATDVGGNSELIQHGADGLLVPYGDPRAMADAIISFLTDRDYAAQLGTRAKAKMRSCFTASKMAEHYANLYRAAKDINPDPCN
ncbi:MAG: glycosyltransferase [bacterium]